MPCYYCHEPLDSYGFEMIGGKERTVCNSCANLKHRYLRGEMGTRRDSLKIGDKVYAEFAGDWFKARIYSVDVTRKPKGEMSHYLCYYEHREYYRDDGEWVEDFQWFTAVRPRAEPAELVDADVRGRVCLMEWLNGEPRDFGNIAVKEMPQAMLRIINESAQAELFPTGAEEIAQGAPHVGG